MDGLWIGNSKGIVNIHLTPFIGDLPVRNVRYTTF